MPVAVISPPEPWISVELAKKHCRIDDDDSDDLLAIYIGAACAAVDGPFGTLQRAVGVQTLELRLESFEPWRWTAGRLGYAWDGGWTDWSFWPFSRSIDLPCPPLIAVESVTYEDATGTDQVLGPTGWVLADDEIDPAFNTTWPSGRMAADAVRIRYTAGYAPAEGGTSTVPTPIQAAALMVIGSLWANREADVIDARAVVAANPAVQNLLMPYRVFG